LRSRKFNKFNKFNSAAKSATRQGTDRIAFADAWQKFAQN